MLGERNDLAHETVLLDKADSGARPIVLHRQIRSSSKEYAAFQAEGAGVQKWEYKIQSLNMSGANWTKKQGIEQRRKLEEALNALGDEGWETVSFDPVDRESAWLLMLKRPKSPS
jgi:hypothetical protein